MDFGFNVVPLYKYSKNPSPFQWKRLETERMTENEFSKLFKCPKMTGLGVVTGKVSNLTVIDEDGYKEGGKTFHLDSPLKALTGNGGKHFFFKYNDKISSTGFKKGVNLEIKSGGGFIVLPPSKVLKKDNKTIGEYKWLEANLKDINLLPTLDEAEVADYKSSPTAPKVSLIDLLDVELGDQHNSLRDFVNRILWKFDPKTWERLAFPVIRKEAKQYKPPHPEWRVEHLIKSCAKWNLERRREKIAPKSLSKIGAERLKEREMEKEVVKTGFRKLDEAIGGLIPGHLIAFTGETNVGKTACVSNFVVNVAKQDKKVLYFALEPGNSIVEYLATIRTKKQFDELSDEDIMYDDGNVHIYTQDDVENVNKLISIVEKLNRYSLVVVDHIGYFIKNKQNLNQEQSDVVKKLARLCKRKRTTIIMIAHLRKGVPEVPTLDDISGSGSFKQDSAEVFIVIRDKDKEDEMKIRYLSTGHLLVAKSKSGENTAVPIEFSHKSAFINQL